MSAPRKWEVRVDAIDFEHQMGFMFGCEFEGKLWRHAVSIEIVDRNKGATPEEFSILLEAAAEWLRKNKDQM